MGRRADRIEERRWSLIEDFLGVDEGRVLQTPARHGRAYWLVYLTTQRLIVARSVDAKLSWLTGWWGIDFSDIDLLGSVIRPETSEFKILATRYVEPSGQVVKDPPPINLNLFPSPISVDLATRVLKKAWRASAQAQADSHAAYRPGELIARPESGLLALAIGEFAVASGLSPDLGLSLSYALMRECDSRQSYKEAYDVIVQGVFLDGTIRSVLGVPVRVLLQTGSGEAGIAVGDVIEVASALFRPEALREWYLSQDDTEVEVDAVQSQSWLHEFFDDLGVPLA